MYNHNDSLTVWCGSYNPEVTLESGNNRPLSQLVVLSRVVNVSSIVEKLFSVPILQQHSGALPLMEPPSHKSYSGIWRRHPSWTFSQRFCQTKVSCEVNCGGAQAGYLGRRVSVCKKGAKLREKRGDLKAQHFFGLDEKTMEWKKWKKTTKKHIFGLCILAGFAKQSKKEVSITSSADFLNHQICSFFSFLIIHRGALTCCDK